MGWVLGHLRDAENVEDWAFEKFVRPWAHCWQHCLGIWVEARCGHGLVELAGIGALGVDVLDDLVVVLVDAVTVREEVVGDPERIGGVYSFAHLYPQSIRVGDFLVE